MLRTIFLICFYKFLADTISTWHKKLINQITFVLFNFDPNSSFYIMDDVLASKFSLLCLKNKKPEFRFHLKYLFMSYSCRAQKVVITLMFLCFKYQMLLRKPLLARLSGHPIYGFKKVPIAELFSMRDEILKLKLHTYIQVEESCHQKWSDASHSEKSTFERKWPPLQLFCPQNTAQSFASVSFLGKENEDFLAKLSRAHGEIWGRGLKGSVSDGGYQLWYKV